MAEPQSVKTMSQRELAQELVKLRKKHGPAFDRADELKSALKDGATESFKEVFAGLGEVAVSPPQPGKFKGIVPTLTVDAFLALEEKERQRLVKDGLVAMVNAYGGKYYGSVTVKLF